MTIKKLFKKLGGCLAVAEKLNIKKSRVYQWQHRNAIPPNIWYQFINIFDVSIDDLQKIRIRK